MQDFPRQTIGFGSAAISGEGKGYGFGDISEKQALELVHYAFESGVRLFDTAPIYGFGLAEQRLGKALKTYRDQIFYVSKSGVTWDQNRRVDKSNEPAVCEQMLNQSLKDLDTDYIDLYMVHWPDPRCDIRYVAEYLAKRQEAGDLRYLGLCNTNQEDFQKVSEIIDVAAIQDTYNAFSAYETQKRYDFLQDKSVYRMAYGTLDKGILTGRVDEKRKFDASDCRSWAPWWKGVDRSEKFDLVRKLESICKRYDSTLLKFAISFTLYDRNFIDIALIGMKTKESIKDCLNCLQNPLSQEELYKIILEWTEVGYSTTRSYD